MISASFQVAMTAASADYVAHRQGYCCVGKFAEKASAIQRARFSKAQAALERSISLGKHSTSCIHIACVKWLASLISASFRRAGSRTAPNTLQSNLVSCMHEPAHTHPLFQFSNNAAENQPSSVCPSLISKQGVKSACTIRPYPCRLAASVYLIGKATHGGKNKNREL